MPASCDLAVALAILLSDATRAEIRRSGWIAWGSLAVDGSLTPVLGPRTNDLPAGPCVGQVWHPDDHLPSPDEDAVISVAGVATLAEAVDAIHFFAEFEDEVFAAQGLSRRIEPALLR